MADCKPEREMVECRPETEMVECTPDLTGPDLHFQSLYISLFSFNYHCLYISYSFNHQSRILNVNDDD